MTAWTKIKKYDGRTSFGRAKRTSPAVVRGSKGNASLVLPEGMVDATRADIFSDGNGRLGFTFGHEGAYAARRANQSSRALRVSIPVKFAERIPMGTTDVVLTNDGPVTVLDLSVLPPAA